MGSVQASLGHEHWGLVTDPFLTVWSQQRGSTRVLQALTTDVSEPELSSLRGGQVSPPVLHLLAGSVQLGHRVHT